MSRTSSIDSFLLALGIGAFTVGVAVMAKQKKATCLWMRCVACRKTSQFWAKDKMLAMKQAFIHKGWSVIRADEYTCPDCTKRIHQGEIPIPKARNNG